MWECWKKDYKRKQDNTNMCWLELLVRNAKALSSFTDALPYSWHNGAVNPSLCSIELLSSPIDWGHYGCCVMMYGVIPLTIVLQSTPEANMGCSMREDVNPKWHLMLNKRSKSSLLWDFANYLQFRAEQNRSRQLSHVTLPCSHEEFSWKDAPQNQQYSDWF